jgi:hypothetical protein
MLAQGLDPTPENLARLAKISAPMARRWLRMKKAHVRADRLALLAVRLQVRTVWLAIGASIPQLSGGLTPEEREALELMQPMDDKLRRYFLDFGKRLIKETGAT